MKVIVAAVLVAGIWMTSLVLAALVTVAMSLAWILLALCLIAGCATLVAVGVAESRTPPPPAVHPRAGHPDRGYPADPSYNAHGVSTWSSGGPRLGRSWTPAPPHQGVGVVAVATRTAAAPRLQQRRRPSAFVAIAGGHR